MAQPIVFFLHGMGNQEKGWSKEATELLQTKASAIKNTWKIRRHELEYDSKFRDLLAAWSKNSKAIIADAQPANQDALKDMLGWLNKADDKASFAWTAAADVFLWRTSSTIRKLIINHLANQVAPVIAKAAAGNARNVHFVAHSLGTAVLHELLSALATGAWTPAGSNQIDGLAATRWRPMGIHTVANVTKILELDRNPAYESVVRPGPPNDSGSYCMIYRNYAHRFDPIAQASPFQPPWAANGFYDSYEPIRIKDVKKVHDLTHYLHLPIVHVPMLESMFNLLPPDSDALDQIPDGFKTPSKAIEDRLKEEIEKFGSELSWFESLRSLYRYLKEL